MKEEEEEEKILSLTNNKSLEDLYVKHQGYCVDWLMKKFTCSKDDAMDITMDALITMHHQQMNNRYVDRNARGYLITIAKNKYLDIRKMATMNIPFDIDKIEYYINRKKGVYNDDFNPVLKNEEENQLVLKEKNEVEAYLHAWNLLSTKCRTLLENYYLKGTKLKDMQHSMNYESYDTIKTIKSRCYKKLKTEALYYLDKNTQ